MSAQPASLRRPSSIQLNWVVPLIPIAQAGFFLSALNYYRFWLTGLPPDGLFQFVVVGFYDFFGFVPALMLFLMVLVWGSIWFITGELDRPFARLLRILGFTLSLCLVVGLSRDGIVAPGWLGTVLAGSLEWVFGGALSTVFAVLAALASMMLATDYLFYRHFDALGRDAASRLRGTATDCYSGTLLAVIHRRLPRSRPRTHRQKIRGGRLLA